MYRFLTVALLFIMADICLADASLPAELPQNWQFKCTLVVFTEESMISTTINSSSGKCTVMQGKNGSGNLSTKNYILNPEELHRIYSAARETIATYRPKALQVDKIPVEKRRKALFNYVTLTLQIGPDRKNGVSSSVYASPPDLEICHFSRIITKLKEITASKAAEPNPLIQASLTPPDPIKKADSKYPAAPIISQ